MEKLKRATGWRPETGLRLAEAGRDLLKRAGGKRDALARFDWVYIGAEFCENLIASPSWYEDQADYFLEKGNKVCIQTPPAGEAGARALGRLFGRLASFAARRPLAAGRIELTINDFGALQLAAEQGLSLPLAAGRALYGNFFFLNRETLRLLNGETLRLLAGMGLRRFEISSSGRVPRANFAILDRFGIKPSDFSLTLHYPYLNLTSARTCISGMPDIGPEDSVDGVRCGHECAACSLEIEHPAINEKLHVRGNAVFLKFPRKFYSSTSSLQKRRIDRLVYSPLP